MHNLIKILNVGLDKINIVLVHISMALIALIIIFETAEIILRKTFSISIPGIIESSEYAIVFITFLSAAWVLRIKGHVRIDIVLLNIPPKVQKIMNIGTSLFSAVLCAFLAIWTYWVIEDMAMRHITSVNSLSIPMMPLYIPVLIGYTLLCIQSLLDTAELIIPDAQKALAKK